MCIFSGLATIGPIGDSFYEYLLKSWILSNQTDANARKMYDKAMEAIVSKQIETSPGGLIYACTNRYKFEQVIHEMHHLACFAGKSTLIYRGVLRKTNI